MKYFDISPPLSPATAVFPGDKAFERPQTLDFALGNHLRLSKIHSTLHIGAHVDAPNHYHADGGDLSSAPISTYLGRAQVIEVQIRPGTRILPSDLGNRPIEAPRILFKTSSFPDPNHWTDQFNALSPELVDYLADRRVKLLGIDTPSVDLATDQELLSHKAIFRRDLRILEGIDLQEVKEGLYTLIAVPLNIPGADASPVRAILAPLELGIP